MVKFFLRKQLFLFPKSKQFDMKIQQGFKDKISTVLIKELTESIFVWLKKMI